MTRSVFILVALMLCLLLLTACGGAAPAATTAPVSNATSAAPSAPIRNPLTPLPLPAQPTTPPIAPRAATPFVAPTFAPIISVPLQGAGTPTTAAGTQPTTAPVVDAGPTAPGVATGIRSELKVEFIAQLSTAEAVDDLRLVLMRIPGILAIAGNETAITIVYDAGLILPNQIRARLASLGDPVKP